MIENWPAAALVILAAAVIAVALVAVLERRYDREGEQ